MGETFSQRIASKVASYPHEVIFVAASDWGVPYILHSYKENEALCIWFKLEPEDQGDPVAQGNKLSDAVTRAFGSQLFGHAMSYGYGLSILRENLALFAPISFIMSGADYGQEFATELLSLQTEGSKVIFAFEDVPSNFLLTDRALLLQESDLKLGNQEALLIAGEKLNETEVFNLNKLNQSKLEPFLIQLNKKLNLPAPMRPSPDGPEAIPGLAPSLPPAIHLQMLLRREQYMEALEVAVEFLPEKVPEFIEKAGNIYMSRGLYKRFQDLIKKLPAELQDYEEVLSWEMRAAKRFGESAKLRDRVVAYLNKHDAPDVRAQYATFLASFQESLVEARRAYEMRKSFLTLLHYGHSLFRSNAPKALEVYREQLAIAEANNEDWQKAQALSNIASTLGLLGRFTEANFYHEETIRTFDTSGSGDWQFRMHVLLNWADTRIKIGETVGLDKLLRNEEKALRDVFPGVAFSFRSTLGEYYLSQKQPHEALAYFSKNYEILSSNQINKARDLPPYVVRDMVKCLLHINDNEQAAKIARKHYFLTKDYQDLEAIFNKQAYAMVKVLIEPLEAIQLLEETIRYFESSAEETELATSCVHMAKAQLVLGDWPAAQASLERAEKGLKELSETGFRLFAGHEEHYRDVFNLWRNQEQTPLILNLLGEAEVVLEGEKQKLYPMWVDTLALMAMHPEGIRKESLELALEKEDGSIPDVKAIISKIRKLIPVSRAPYKLELPLFADFLELENMLKEGRVRAALELYRGPLLKKSRSQGIIEARETFEEMLRQAVLDSADPEVLLSLSERFKDDLELWEATLEVLPHEDPRRSVATAKHKKLQEAWGM